MDQILYRVLSFDGGGIRGLYHAKLLECLKASGLDVVKRADIVAGTSTGAIVAAGLAIGKEPETITALYTGVGEKVFPHRGWPGRAFETVRTAFSCRPSYSTAVLRDALETELGKTTTLGDCSRRLIVPAISLNQYKLKVFDSKDDSDKRHRLVDVVLASAAAPTYFLPARVGDTYYADGGLCCNNPAFRAVACLYREGVELPRIYVLSISTGAVPITKAGNKFMRLHKFRWIRPAIDLAMSGSSDVADQDGALVGYHCRVADSFESQIALDDYREALAVLPPLAERKAEEVRKEVARWFTGPEKSNLDFTGRWETTFAWGAAEASDTLDVSQSGQFVFGETVQGSGQWEYTLSGTVQENVFTGTWKGPILHGSFLLVMSRENRTVSGFWTGTGDAELYFGKWSWKRKHE